jgi:ubiquinol-cytochrome c reductase iron-sulfur subunit
VANSNSTVDAVDDTGRRDFITVAAGAFAVIGLGPLVWPMLDQMNPDASALALGSVEIDLAPIDVGQAITIMWRGKPIFIRNRAEEEIQAAEVTQISALPDRFARNLNIADDAPAVDRNRAGEGHENWLVIIGICTHLGCIPRGQRVGDTKGEFGGWFCPCHGSHYDTAGRIRRGPAPRNMEVPPYKFLTDTRIKIG